MEFPAAVIHQQFAVPFSYKVHFTTGLFRRDNPVLAEVIGSQAHTLPKKVFVVIDSGVARHHSYLPDQLATYADIHLDVLRLVAEPMVVPGGEQCKNTPELLDTLLRRIHTVGLCRHSY